MFVLLLPLIFVGAGSVWWIQDNYRALWEHEQNQIAVDNAGIAFGRETRKLLRWFERFQTRVDAWEKIHHGIHRCARVPSPVQEKCAATDAAFERSLTLWHRYAGVKLRSGWMQSEWAARKQAQAQGIRILPGFANLKLSELPCRRCRRVPRWKLVFPTEGAAIRIRGSRGNVRLIHRATLVWQKGKDALWNFQLLP